jgi:hypothetical protein
MSGGLSRIAVAVAAMITSTVSLTSSTGTGSVSATSRGSPGMAGLPRRPPPRGWGLARPAHRYPDG